MQLGWRQHTLGDRLAGYSAILMDLSLDTEVSKLLLCQEEMLGSVKAAGGADWCILIMDSVTTRVMSRAARISEILDYGVSCAPPPLPLLLASRGSVCTALRPPASTQEFCASHFAGARTLKHSTCTVAALGSI